MSIDADAMLEKVRDMCLAYPKAAEKRSHGMPAFYIENGKIFVWFWHDHHGDGRTAVLVKLTGPEEQEALIEADPDLYYRPPYLGPFGWVAIRLDRGEIDWDHIADRIAMSWDLIAPRKLKETR